MKLGFFGAAQTVTGSKYLVSTDRARLLVDCGLFQGLKSLRLRNWTDPGFDAASLDAVVLTHAHIDHSGYLPRLCKTGFRGPVYCTPGTQALLHILLPATSDLDPSRVSVTHGEPSAADAFRRRLVERFGWSVIVPTDGTTHDLDAAVT